MGINYSAILASLLPSSPGNTPREIHPQRRDLVNNLMQHNIPLHPVPISPGERRKEYRKIDFNLIGKYLTENSEGIILSAENSEQTTQVSQFFRNSPYEIQVKKLSPEERKLNNHAQFYIGLKRV